MIRSGFTQRTVALNRLGELDFKAWSFRSGMSYANSNKWWGDRGARLAPHEGTDIAAFVDGRGTEHWLTTETIVPPLFEGRLVLVAGDFLGLTIIAAHDIINRHHQTLHTFYAHLSPLQVLTGDAPLHADRGMATIAAGNRTNIPAHLHLSAAWVSPAFPLAGFTWPDFTERPGFQPCDPLIFL